MTPTNSTALRLVSGQPTAPSQEDSRQAALHSIAPQLVATQRPRVGIVIPAFNEEKNILNVLREIRTVAAQYPHWEFRAFVINDGSKDRTELILNEAAHEWFADVVHLPVNLGIGRAVQTGFRMAVRWGADVTLQLDGDGQHPAGEIPKIVAPVLSGESDVVVGSRYVAGAGGNVSTKLRQFGTWFFSRLLRVLVGARIEDTTSGFRAFGAEAVDLLARHYPDDYPEVQAYVPLARSRFRIREVPVTMRPRQGGRSSITALKSVYYMIKVAFSTAIDVVRPIPSVRKREKLRGVIDGR